MANIRANTQILPNTISDNLFMDHRWKQPVRLLETSVNLGLSNGATIDSVAVTTGDRIGVFGQTTASENGVYIADTAGVWTRTDDFEVGDAVAAASFVIEEGTNFSNTTWIITNNSGNDVVATHSLVCAQTGGTGMISGADNGLTKNGSVIEMGGTLNQNTTIDKNLQTLYINGEGAIRLEDDNGGTAQVSRVEVDWSAIYMRHYGTTGQYSRFMIDQSNMTFTDNINNVGCIYAADYSTNFTNESLITKRYVDNLINGRQWKEPVRALIDGTNVTGNQALTGAATIDGVTLATGERVGLFDQTSTAEDGVYVVDTTGAWSRALDWASNDSAANYTFYVQEGTVNADFEYTVTNNSGSDVIGVNDLVTKATGGQATITAGAGMVRNANAFDVVATDLSLVVNADDMSVNIGATNGTSLEVSATGLELTSNVTGSRTFTQGAGESFTIANTDLNSPTMSISPDGTVPLAIATVAYVDSINNNIYSTDGNLVSNRVVTLNSNTLTFEAGTATLFAINSNDGLGATGVISNDTSVAKIEADNANAGNGTVGSSNIRTHINGLLVNQSGVGGADGYFRFDADYSASYVNRSIVDKEYVDAVANTRQYNETTALNVGGQTATLSVAPVVGLTNAVVYLNGVRQILTTDYTVTNVLTGEVTFTAAQPITTGDVVIVDYSDQ